MVPRVCFKAFISLATVWHHVSLGFPLLTLLSGVQWRVVLVMSSCSLCMKNNWTYKLGNYRNFLTISLQLITTTAVVQGNFSGNQQLLINSVWLTKLSCLFCLTYTWYQLSSTSKLLRNYGPVYCKQSRDSHLFLFPVCSSALLDWIKCLETKSVSKLSCQTILMLFKVLQEIGELFTLTVNQSRPPLCTQIQNKFIQTLISPELCCQPHLKCYLVCQSAI